MLPEIRRAQPEDAASLAAFGARIFADTFGVENSAEDLQAYLSTSYGEEKQLAEINDPLGVTLVAEMEAELVAFAQVRKNEPPGVVVGDQPVELWRFYVDQPWQGKGLAQRLMQDVTKAAKELGGKVIWLSVWEKNQRAISFYRKCGFEQAGLKDFWLGSDRQTDLVLSLEIVDE
jgi:diamine N-acetyltransferase